MTRHQPEDPTRSMRAGTVGLLAFAVLAAATGTALAAAIPSTTATLGSGSAAVTRCGDLSSAQAGYAVSAGVVTEVTVTGIAPGCLGGRLTVTLVGATGSVLATAPAVVVGASTATVTGLTVGVSPGAVGSVAIALVGP